LLGVLIALLLVSYFGFDNVAGAVGRVGWSQFGMICAWQIVIFVVVGVAWDVILPASVKRPAWVMVWGRMVRDAAANCLPFSQVGAFVFGARAVTLHGVAWHTAAASTAVDVAAEFLAQIAFAGIGLGVLLARAPESRLAVPMEVGIGLAVLACFGFVWAQKGAVPVIARIGRRIAGRWFGNAGERMEVFQEELATMYSQTGKLALGFFLHLIGWLCTGVAGWITYHALGVPIDFDDAMAIEALLAASAVLTFLVPVNAGVQEAGYAALGAIFGVPADLSLAVSLVRRGRDIVVGVPILLVWQYVEMRRLRETKRVAAEVSAQQ
jgi:putative membrane protein